MLSSARPRPGDSLPLFDLNQRIELQQYSSRTSKPNGSATLADLLKWVDEARDETRNRNTARAYWSHPTSPSLSTTPPFVLSFHNLTYSVKNRPKMAVSSLFHRKKSQELGMKVLLNDISGEAKEGEIMAVLGASGSGKSTLIDALANRIAKESLGGTITLNGEVLESRLSKVISAYVMQDDLLYPMLTVEETLMFSAEFRLPRSLSKRRKRARVRALIDQLGLRNAANTVIGDEGHRGVSGGERRRVSIGIDIIHDPIILFLDEPTSGLDSTSAFMVVKVLQRIAQSGSIVIMSIHQPSYRILSLLDRMIFLSRGDTVYNGSPASLPRFFSEFGHPIPEYENKTEFALDLIQELEESPGGTKNMVEFNKSWQRSRNLIQNANRPDRRSRTPKVSLRDAIAASMAKGKLVSGATTSDPSLASSVPKFANPFWMEMFVISRRSLTNSRRAPELFGTRLGAVLVTAVIFATIFHNLSDTPRGVQERVGFLALAMSTTFYICAEAMPMFIQDRYIFMRETAYNAYRRSSYVLAHLIISLPSLVILSLAFVSVTFWMIGLEGGLDGFLFFLYAVMAAFWVGSSYVTFLSGIVSHVVLGFTVVIAIIAYFVLFSGFFITRDRIPPYWIWFHYISLVKYPYDSIVQSEFGGADKCFVRGLQMFDSTPLGAFPTSVKLKLLKNMGNALKMNITASTCVTTGADILKMQGITDLSKWSALWITVAWGFFFRILFYFTLRLGSKNKRR